MYCSRTIGYLNKYKVSIKCAVPVSSSLSAFAEIDLKLIEMHTDCSVEVKNEI